MVPPAAPKTETAAKPNDPQLHAPELTPRIDPKNPTPDFLIPLPIMRILYMLKLETNPDKDAIISINVKSKMPYSGT